MAGRITLTEFAQVMKQLKVPPSDSFGVGVSGSPESLALTMLLKEYAGSDKVLAIVVEHKLRDDRVERDAGRKIIHTLTSAGLNTRRRVIDWSKQGSPLSKHSALPAISKEAKSSMDPQKLEVQARQRRYNLLIDSCTEARMNNLVLGHPVERQVSVSLYRFLRGGGIDGLSGFKAAKIDSDSMSVTASPLKILRPVLGFPTFNIFSMNTVYVIHQQEQPF
ncbi:hypothetical protein HDV05_008217 [Chytridiales sp. JEL 0842]|nr:hypothetical protein HDV05_008217 [Chytridiales sp. JEL 0842]